MTTAEAAGQLATENGKAFALDALMRRRATHRARPTLDNARLPAGAPMFYRCIGCGADIVVPEAWLTKPDCCRECEALIALGWME